MRKRHTVFILLFFSTVIARAQESILPDVSYPYLEKLVSLAKQNYPRVKLLQNRIDLAQSGVSKAGLSWFDFFTFSYIYQPNNTLNYTVPTTTSTTTNRFLFNGIQLGLSLNLGSLLLKPANIKIAKTEVKIAGEEQSEYLITLATDVKRRYFTYLLQQNLVKLQTQAYLDMQNLLKQNKSKFQKSEIPFETYNASLLMAATRTEQKLQAEAGFFIAKSELEALIGARLEDIN